MTADRTRRGLLATVGAALGGLAGCSGLIETGADTVTRSSTDTPTDRRTDDEPATPTATPSTPAGGRAELTVLVGSTVRADAFERFEVAIDALTIRSVTGQQLALPVTVERLELVELGPGRPVTDPVGLPAGRYDRARMEASIRTVTPAAETDADDGPTTGPIEDGIRVALRSRTGEPFRVRADWSTQLTIGLGVSGTRLRAVGLDVAAAPATGGGYG